MFGFGKGREPQRRDFSYNRSSVPENNPENQINPLELRKRNLIARVERTLDIVRREENGIRGFIRAIERRIKKQASAKKNLEALSNGLLDGDTVNEQRLTTDEAKFKEIVANMPLLYEKVDNIPEQQITQQLGEQLIADAVHTVVESEQPQPLPDMDSESSSTTWADREYEQYQTLQQQPEEVPSPILRQRPQLEMVHPLRSEHSETRPEKTVKDALMTHFDDTRYPLINTLRTNRENCAVYLSADRSNIILEQTNTENRNEIPVEYYKRLLDTYDIGYSQTDINLVDQLPAEAISQAA